MTTTTIILAGALVLAIAAAAAAEIRGRRAASSWAHYAGELARERDERRVYGEAAAAEVRALRREREAESAELRDEATRAGVLAEGAQQRRRELERQVAHERDLGRHWRDRIAVLEHELERRAAAVSVAGELVGHELVVHTRRPDDQSVRGVCVHATELELHLIGARYLSGSSESPLGGEVRIPRAHVAFAQVLDAPAAGEPELEAAAAAH